MEGFTVIGKSIPRKESIDKVTGAAKYTNDYIVKGMLYVRLVTSPYAHARIKSIDISKAQKSPGVRSVITGKYFPHLTGGVIRDKPIIAIDKVRYYGEPVAAVVADTEAAAQKAAQSIEVKYESLSVVNSPSDALKNDAPLVHEDLANYKRVMEASPEANTNIASRIKVRKGHMNMGWEHSEVIVEEKLSFPPSDHVTMETRCAQVEILPNGDVIVYSTSQSPFEVKKLMSEYFNIPPGKVIVNVPLVGGAYGGKTPVQWELIAFLASKSVNGRLVKLTSTREEDLVTFPVHIGLDAKIKLGSTKNGRLTAVEITYLFDGGAYSDRAIIIAKAAALDCTGPYRIDNVWCDSLCMYTNHPYATAFRGFGHPELTFVIERAIDTLAGKINIDSMELRLKNSIMPGDTTPTRVILNRSNIGNLPKCIEKLSQLINWEEGDLIQLDNNKVRAKGISCFWKNSNTPVNAEGGAILTFNRDGSINLICGAVEIGQGTKTVLAQMLAERMRMNVDRVYVEMKVNTKSNPEHWKTAASRTILLVGGAVLDAAEDAIKQLFKTAAIVLRCREGDLDLTNERVFLKDNPKIGIDIKEIAHGYTYPNGNSIEGQVVGRGKFILKHLTHIDPNTGCGKAGPELTVGASAVEVELDLNEYSYKILKAATVIDAGKVLNPKGAHGQIIGGMSMGLSFANREEFIFDNEGVIKNISLRTYRVIHYGENPEYLVDFVETPEIDAPYGARGIGEYGVIGMPAALANSLSKASDTKLNKLPLLPEVIWRTKKEKKDD
ncbi:xanthine dehydrogenase family protein molybdopterin-binding subunit [Clostridium sp. DJ247]|uniref:xanthine dehydrogenase family protein molybdopterin-binding subunit n=1 Tax=Clostridium sp. DJ247 TaxID=2726188 RepID=UPI001629BA1C|nr:xanthine dehydrogenase family protein molybdopterin-binding subunit [Clostridium sp. DJ247]MBC2581632.1 xanthine dehydrogenase family protein molybdopterin-binding subunit [Clostridium sp. DJ247]